MMRGLYLLPVSLCIQLVSGEVPQGTVSSRSVRQHLFRREAQDSGDASSLGVQDVLSRPDGGKPSHEDVSKTLTATDGGDYRLWQTGRENLTFEPPVRFAVEKNYTVCSAEGENCTCDGTVFFGRKYASGKPGSGRLGTIFDLTNFNYLYKKTHGVTINCSVTSDNETSGFKNDPASGWHKHCICEKPNALSVSETKQCAFGSDACQDLLMASQFLLHKLGSDSCRDGFEEIRDSATCAEALNSTGQGATQANGLKVSATTADARCVYDASTNEMQLIDETATQAASHKVVCKKSCWQTLIEESAGSEGCLGSGLDRYSGLWQGLDDYIRLEWVEATAPTQRWIQFVAMNDPFKQRPARSPAGNQSSNNFVNLTDFETNDENLAQWIAEGGGAMLCFSTTAANNMAWAILPRDAVEFGQGCSGASTGKGAFYGGSTAGWLGAQKLTSFDASTATTRSFRIKISVCDILTRKSGCTKNGLLGEYRNTYAHHHVYTDSQAAKSACESVYGPGNCKTSGYAYTFGHGTNDQNRFVSSCNHKGYHSKNVNGQSAMKAYWESPSTPNPDQRWTPMGSTRINDTADFIDSNRLGSYDGLAFGQVTIWAFGTCKWFADLQTTCGYVLTRDTDGSWNPLSDAETNNHCAPTQRYLAPAGPTPKVAECRDFDVVDCAWTDNSTCGSFLISDRYVVGKYNSGDKQCEEFRLHADVPASATYPIMDKTSCEDVAKHTPYSFEDKSSSGSTAQKGCGFCLTCSSSGGAAIVLYETTKATNYKRVCQMATDSFGPRPS